jgi:ligand-binding SRPBCC domain-containing protein
MKLFCLHTTQCVPISIAEAWAFFSDPRNLPHITPPSMKMRITSAPAEKMHPGMIITYRICPFRGISADWVTEIAHVVEPHLFVDEQRFGPYRFWHHQHHFQTVEGGVRMQDVVHYAIPLGVLGAAANLLLIRKRLEGIFDFRRQVIERMFGVL